mmetsp:Transcript_6239/g.5361  ORF Transcript_6239/g.5361 Transcript_6239/m.5361 type:complete len:205 (-) Transcript_6239:315-929(-)
MFKDFIEWRKENQVDHAFINYEVSNIPEVKTIYKAGYHGTDREGRPFYIDCPCTAAPAEKIFSITDSEELTRNYIRQYEWLLHVRFPSCSNASKTKIDKIFSIVDLNGLTMDMFKEKNREYVKLRLGLGQNNYPETMHSLFVINSPFIFKAIWAILKAFVAERTKKKIKILGSKYQKELFEVVDPDNIPKQFGGNCTCEERGGD